MLYQILALFIWSSAFVAAKYTYTMLDPVLMVQLRLLIAALLVWPFFLRCWKQTDKPMRKQLWGLAFFNYTAVFLLQFIGAKYTSAASAVTMIGLEPLLVVFVGHFFFKDKAQWFHWIFGALAFIGVAVLIAGSNTEGEISLFGCALILSAGVIFAACLRWTRAVIGLISAQSYTAISIVLGTLATIPFTLILTGSWQIHFNWAGLWGLIYLGIGCSWLAFWLWNKGLNSVDANVSGILTALEPLFGIFLAVFMLGEHISFISWVGIVIIIVATLCSTLLPKLIGKKHHH